MRNQRPRVLYISITSKSISIEFGRQFYDRNGGIAALHVPVVICTERSQVHLYIASRSIINSLGVNLTNKIWLNSNSGPATASVCHTCLKRIHGDVSKYMDAIGSPQAFFKSKPHAWKYVNYQTDIDSSRHLSIVSAWPSIKRRSNSRPPHVMTQIRAGHSLWSETQSTVAARHFLLLANAP